MSKRFGRWAISLVSIITVGLAAVPPAFAWTFGQSHTGRDAHPMIVARNGGIYPNEDIAKYVTAVGMRLARKTEQANEGWVFTVLDTPTVSAFAQPGGYIYVTRGLLAFVNDEAELASILAHQMVHSLENHFPPTGEEAAAAPDSGLAPDAVLDGLIGGRKDGTFALPPSVRTSGGRPIFSDQMDVVAAIRGVDILTRAGYPGAKSVAFAKRLLAQDTWSRDVDGMGDMMLFGETPLAKADTVAAIELAVRDQVTDISNIDFETPYLSAIRGLVYGDSPARGLIRDGKFIHPELRFSFELPEGFTPEITAGEVIARGPNGAMLVLDTTDQAGERLESYIRDKWAPSLTRSVRSGYLYDLTPNEIGGFDAASGFQPYDDDSGPKVAQLVVIRADKRVYRFRAISAAADFDLSQQMEAAIDTFEEVPVTLAATFKPYWIHVHEIQPGDSVNLFAAAMPMRDGAEAHFRALNGYADGRVPMVGELVKLVME